MGEQFVDLKNCWQRDDITHKIQIDVAAHCNMNKFCEIYKSEAKDQKLQYKYTVIPWNNILK